MTNHHRKIEITNIQNSLPVFEETLYCTHHICTEHLHCVQWPSDSSI